MKSYRHKCPPCSSLPGVVCAVTVAALLCGIPSAAGQGMQKPRLEPNLPQTLLEPGQTLRVTCQADRPVTWNVTSLDEDISSRVSIVNDTASGDYSHESVLEIRDVMYLDVGYQSCQFVGASGPDQAASVYLFVNDSEHLLVSVGSFISVTLSQNRRGVIPCRPSHPGVKVTLKRFMSTEVADFILDERVGFVVPSAEMHMDHMVCVAGDNQEQLTFFVTVTAATDSVQQPSIDTSNARQNAVLGYNFSLECSVHRELGQMLVFSWDVPPASTGLKTGRMEEGPPEVSLDGQQFTNRLLVTDTRPEDEGSFTCHVKDHNGHTNNRTVQVTVHSPNVSSVKLRTDVRSFSMRLGDTIKIVVNMESRPSPDVIWLDPEGKEIITDPSKYFVTSTAEQTILEILDLRLKDMGQYRVNVTARSDTSTASDELTFQVTVSDQPRVQLGPGQRFYTAGERYTLSCTATGYPTPSLEWRFQPCSSSHSCAPHSDDQNLTLANAEEETQVQSAPYLLQSDLHVTANQSGMYWCYANNSESDLPAGAEHRFFVSDIAGGFGIQRSNASVIEGDNVTISCGGSMLDFLSPSSLAWQWSAANDNQASVPATDLPGVRVQDQTNEYSYRKVLVLDPVQMKHDGLLSCTGDNVGGGKNRSSTRLRVIASEKPVFTAAANMDRSASLQLEEGDRVELNCAVTGQPTPTITWTKDGVRLRLDGDRIQLLDDDQRLVVATVLNSDAGNYECRALNRDGAVSGSAELLVPGDDTMTRVVVPVAVLLSLILVGLILCLAWKSRQQQSLQKKLTRLELIDFRDGKIEQINPELPIDEQAALLPYEPDEWEFPKDRLMLGRQIGSGAFGRVLKADAIGLTPEQQRTVVAVKMPKSGSDPDQIRSLMSELKIMIQLGKHLNVVNLLGAVTKHAIDGEFMVLVEYCRHGNLHQYLHRHKNSFINQVHPITGEFDATLGEEEFHAALRRDSTSESTPLQYAQLEHDPDGRLTVTPGRSFYQPPRRGSTASSVHSATWDAADFTGRDDAVCQSPGAGDDERVRFNTLSTGGTAGRRTRRTPLTTRNLLQWSFQVARGMEYLASRKLLHGDLAARNILLAENNIVKISDFGLSRDIYKTKDYRKKGKGLLPVKWMAIESIQESIFSTQSDVWAFGVVLWELFSLGSTPYPGMEYDVNFVRRLRDGYRMEAPKFSPNATYELMKDCWKEAPSSRPSFTELSERLGHCLEEHVRKDYIQLNEPYQAMNTEYFTRRVDYVNSLISPDYQNVTPRRDSLGAGTDRGSTGSQASHEGVIVLPGLQTVGYTAPVKGGGQTPLVDADSYLLMSPGSEMSSDDGVFSPRLGSAAPRPGAHFQFPPPPQLAGESPPPPTTAAAANGFYNPSYHEAGKGRVPSTPKMGTRVSRSARPAAVAAAAGETDGEEHYRSPKLSPTQLDGDEYRRLSEAESGGAHYQIPVPVGCEQLA